MDLGGLVPRGLQVVLVVKIPMVGVLKTEIGWPEYRTWVVKVPICGWLKYRNRSGQNTDAIHSLTTVFKKVVKTPKIFRSILSLDKIRLNA